jgi:hypothetical protein
MFVLWLTPTNLQYRVPPMGVVVSWTSYCGWFMCPRAVVVTRTFVLRLVPAPSATFGSCTWCCGWFLHLMIRLVPAPGDTIGSCTWCYGGSCTWCYGWFLHLVLQLVPAPGATVGSCTWCYGWFLHLVLRLVPAPGDMVGS